MEKLNSGIQFGTNFFLWLVLLFLGFNIPLLTMYGVILGNKKSAWYYLLSAPAFVLTIIAVGVYVYGLFT